MNVEIAAKVKTAEEQWHTSRVRAAGGAVASSLPGGRVPYILDDLSGEDKHHAH